MIKKSVQIFQDFGYLLLPGTCILCQAASHRRLDLCLDCEHDLPTLGAHCQQCALPLEQSLSTHNITPLRCGQCLQTPPKFDRLRALFPYEMPIARLINDLKFHDRLVNAHVLGTLMAQHLQRNNTAWPEIIIPVPLHPKRLKERGYNQALELARPISKQLSIPINYRLCQRLRHTAHQAGSNISERHKNLRGAFCALSPIPKQVAIIDDVVTTMSTVNELASCLRTAGAEKIEVWCVARTILK